MTKDDALEKKAENARELGLDYEPAQPMHPEIKKLYEDYFDKGYRESSSAVPENFIDALRFDVAMRDVDAEQPAQRTWVGLTDEELSEFDVDPIEAKLMIAKLKEKNT